VASEKIEGKAQKENEKEVRTNRRALLKMYFRARKKRLCNDSRYQEGLIPSIWAEGKKATRDKIIKPSPKK